MRKDGIYLISSSVDLSFVMFNLGPSAVTGFMDGGVVEAASLCSTAETSRGLSAGYYADTA